MNIPTLTAQFATSFGLLQANLQGFTLDNASNAPAHGGNSLSWLLSHIIASRQGALLISGGAPLWDGARLERWAQGAAALTNADDAAPLTELHADLAATQAALMAHLSTLDDEALAQPTPYGEPVGGVLMFLTIHEAYHVGQVGLLRRTLGLSNAIG
jgi:uncharacterized damage-inducible protein DinB